LLTSVTWVPCVARDSAPSENWLDGDLRPRRDAEPASIKGR
jgi:hypothetical protein